MSHIFRRGFQIIREEGYSAFLRRTSRRIVWVPFHFVLILWVVHRFRDLVHSVKDIDGAVYLAFSFSYHNVSITPLQIREEIVELLKLVERAKPNVLLEVGTADGGTLYLFASVATPRATVISIDLPSGYPGWRVHLYKSFARGKQRIRLVRGDSHDIRTLTTVEQILAGLKVDFLFIDGDHTYEGVRRDFEMYSPLVRKGGIVALHDILPHDSVHDPERTVGVDRLWTELRDKYDCLEIVKTQGQGWAGIGVVSV